MRTVSSFSSSALRLAIATLFLLVLNLPSSATEVIRSFSSNLTLLENGSVDVTEIIEVRAEGRNIRRGIFRDIPLVLINDDNSELRSKLTVIQVLRDGEPEPWFRRKIGTYARIYIGDEDVFLNVGTYRYTIHYTMTRMARRFEDSDEIYWNATGNFWDFPIESAVATINLPKGAVAKNIDAYTGAFGATGSDFTATRTSDTQVVFRANRVFSKGEGMSVAVSFQKGILAEPDATERTLNYISDHRDVVVPGIAVFIVLFFYLFVWNAVGRDPKKGTIIPLFHAPEGYSPALVLYISNMGWRGQTWRAFSAAIFNLAVKGLVTIEKVGKRTTMAVVEGAIPGYLPPGEAIVYSYFSRVREVSINKTTGPKLSAERNSLVGAIETENRHAYFINNYRYVFAGVGISILGIVAMMVAGVLSIEWLVAGIFGGGVLVVFISIFRSLWAQGGFVKFFGYALIGFFLVNFVGTFGLRVFDAIKWTAGIDMPAVAAATIIAVNVLFAVLMRAPTVQGRRVMDQIEGFRMYLETAEKERLNLVGEPKMTTRRFEEILPYAIALGVEKPWSKHFEGELSRNAVADAKPGYRPHWYHSSSISKRGIGADMAALGTGMGAAMAAAQPVSSSSSGSSGGGSSGGGGGGGGGGGW